MFNFFKNKENYGFSEETKAFLKKMHGNEYFLCNNCEEEFPMKNEDGKIVCNLKNAICPKCGGSDISCCIAHFFFRRSPWESFIRFIKLPIKFFKIFMP